MRKFLAALALAFASLPALASISFDGTNDQLRGTLATQRGDPLTFGCFVKAATTGAQRNIFQLGANAASNNDSYRIGHGSTTFEYRNYSVDSAGTENNGIFDGIDFDAVWVAVVGVTASDSSRTVYVDDIANTGTNGTTRTVAGTLDDIAIGENLADTQDMSGLIAECALWDGVLENAEITAYMNGTPAPDVADTESLIGYWPLDTNGDLTNHGADTGGDLTASGNAAFNADHPVIGSPPTFDAGLVETADTTTALTFSYDLSADADTFYGALFRPNATPTAAEVKAGTGANSAVATEASTGAADSIVMTTNDADPEAVYDAKAVGENEGGLSSVDTERGVMEAPANQTYFEVDPPPGGAEVSVWDSSGIADNDYGHTTLFADCFIHGPDAHAVTMDADGTYIIDTASDPPLGTCNVIGARYQDFSDVAGTSWSQATLANKGANCAAPEWIGRDPVAFPDGFLFPVNGGNIVTLASIWSHAHDRTMTFNVDNVPSGGSEDGTTLNADFDTCGVYADVPFQATDDLDQETEELVDITVGSFVPDVLGDDAATAITAIEGECSFTATAGEPRFDPVVALGDVIETDPPPGTLVGPTQEVTYFLSAGPAPGGSAGGPGRRGSIRLGLGIH